MAMAIAPATSVIHLYHKLENARSVDDAVATCQDLLASALGVPAGAVALQFRAPGSAQFVSYDRKTANQIIKHIRKSEGSTLSKARSAWGEQKLDDSLLLSIKSNSFVLSPATSPQQQQQQQHQQLLRHGEGSFIVNLADSVNLDKGSCNWDSAQPPVGPMGALTVATSLHTPHGAAAGVTTSAQNQQGNNGHGGSSSNASGWPRNSVNFEAPPPGHTPVDATSRNRKAASILGGRRLRSMSNVLSHGGSRQEDGGAEHVHSAARGGPRTQSLPAFSVPKEVAACHAPLWSVPAQVQATPSNSHSRLQQAMAQAVRTSGPVVVTSSSGAIVPPQASYQPGPSPLLSGGSNWSGALPPLTIGSGAGLFISPSGPLSSDSLAFNTATPAVPSSFSLRTGQDATSCSSGSSSVSSYSLAGGVHSIFGGSNSGNSGTSAVARSAAGFYRSGDSNGASSGAAVASEGSASTTGPTRGYVPVPNPHVSHVSAFEVSTSAHGGSNSGLVQHGGSAGVEDGPPHHLQHHMQQQMQQQHNAMAISHNSSGGSVVLPPLAVRGRMLKLDTSASTSTTGGGSPAWDPYGLTPLRGQLSSKAKQALIAAGGGGSGGATVAQLVLPLRCASSSDSRGALGPLSSDSGRDDHFPLGSDGISASGSGASAVAEGTCGRSFAWTGVNDATELQGVITVSRPFRSGDAAGSAFTKDELSLAQIVAEILPQALCRICQRMEAVALQKRTASLVEMIRTISTETETSSILAHLTDIAYELLSADRVSVFIVDRPRNEVVMIVSEDAAGVRLPLGKGIVGHVVARGTPLLISDAYSSPLFSPKVDQETGYKTREILAVPIKDSEGNTIAVIEAMNKLAESFTPTAKRAMASSAAGGSGVASPGGGSGHQQGPITSEHEFDEDDIRSLAIVADTAGVALHKAALLDAANSARAVNEALLEVVRDINELPVDVEEGLSSFTRRLEAMAQRLVPSEHMRIFFVDKAKGELYWPACSSYQPLVAPVGGGESNPTSAAVCYSSRSSSGSLGCSAEDASPCRIVRCHLGAGVTGRVAVDGSILNLSVQQLSDVPFSPQTDMLGDGNPPRHMLLVPVRAFDNEARSQEGSVIAVIQASNYYSGAAFNALDESLLEAFSIELASLLERKSLHLAHEKAVADVSSGDTDAVRMISMLNQYMGGASEVPGASRRQSMVRVRTPRVVAHQNSFSSHISQQSASMRSTGPYSPGSTDTAGEQLPTITVAVRRGSLLQGRNSTTAASLQTSGSARGDGLMGQLQVSPLRDQGASDFDRSDTGSSGGTALVFYTDQLSSSVAAGGAGSDGVAPLSPDGAVDRSLAAAAQVPSAVPVPGGGRSQQQRDLVTRVRPLSGHSLDGGSSRLISSLLVPTAALLSGLSPRQQYLPRRGSRDGDPSQPLPQTQQQQQQAVVVDIGQSPRRPPRAASTKSQRGNDDTPEQRRSSLVDGSLARGLSEPALTRSSSADALAAMVASRAASASTSVVSLSQRQQQHKEHLNSSGQQASGSPPSSVGSQKASPPFSSSTHSFKGSPPSAGGGGDSSFKGSPPGSGSNRGGGSSRRGMRLLGSSSMRHLEHVPAPFSSAAASGAKDETNSSSSTADLQPWLGLPPRRGRDTASAALLELSFNPLLHSPAELVEYAVDMVHLLQLPSRAGVEIDIIARFVADVHALYRSNPYHNFAHALSVMHVCFLALHRSYACAALLQPVEQLAVLLAALSHDVDHPGVNNGHEAATLSDLALRYNDQSVLEHHHAATMFQLLQPRRLSADSGSDTPAAAAIEASRQPEVADRVSLLRLDRPAYTRFRAAAIAGILATDMKHHDSLTDASRRLRPGRENVAGVSPKLLIELLLHGADLSNPILPSFPVVHDWAGRVCAEFSAQVDREKALGLPFAPHMDGLTSPQAVAKMQLGFIDYVVSPLWTTLTTNLFPELAEVRVNLAANRAQWAAIAAASSQL